MSTTVETRLATLEEKVARFSRIEERLMTLSDTVARLVVIEEQRVRTDADIRQELKKLTTPSPAQERIREILEESLTKAEREKKAAQEALEAERAKADEDSNKSEKWMRDLIIILLSATLGGGAVGSRFFGNDPVPPPAIGESMPAAPVSFDPPVSPIPQ